MPKEPADQSLVQKLQQALQIDTSLCEILVQRQISDFETARHFFRPQLGHLLDPFLMKDMEKAVYRIHQAIQNGENILIYGDYDVDGTTAVALTYQFFKSIHPNILYYLPDRYTEGYGISFQGIDYAASQNCKLIIALDCGIRAIDKVEYAKALQIDFIIADHHLPGAEIPDAVAILDPKQIDCDYPFKELSGCGIGFKMAQAYAELYELDEQSYLQYLDLVALSIAADLVSLLDENRVLAHYGLEKLNKSPSPGLKYLIQHSGRPTPLNMTDLGFQLAPPINAAGRMGHAMDALKLLLANPDEAPERANFILSQNIQRREDDQDITAKALAILKDSPGFLQKKTTVVYHKTWNKGIIGIVASRLIEQHYRPTIVLTESNGLYTGSARSVSGFDLYEALVACSDLLVQFGGHKFAAGLSVSPENLISFSQRFEEVVSNTIDPRLLEPEIKYDVELQLNQIDQKFYRIMMQMGPFGTDNLCPLFVSHELELVEKPKILKDKHLKLKVKQQNSAIFEVIAFGLAEAYENLLKPSITFSLCYQIELNSWKNNTSLQLNAKAIRF